MFVQRPTTRNIFIGNPAVTVSETTKQTASSNWWEAGGATGALMAFTPKGAASLAASYVNLANAGTYDAAVGTAPTLNSYGWLFNGTNQYLRTGFAAGSTGMSYAVRMKVNGATASFSFGSYGGKYFTLQMIARDPQEPPGAQFIYYGNGSQADGVHDKDLTTDFVIIVKGQQGYFNGVADGGTIGAGSGGFGTDFFIGAIADSTASNNPAGYFQPCSIAALAVWNNTSIDVAAITAEMQAL